MLRASTRPRRASILCRPCTSMSSTSGTSTPPRSARSSRGRSAPRLRIWRRPRPGAVLGFGFPTPYLGFFRDGAERVLAFMPAGQGVIDWPSDRPVGDGAGGGGRAAAARFQHRHPCSSSMRWKCRREPDALMAECRRVLASGGRLVVVVPNRQGPWARSDLSPFGLAGPIRAASSAISSPGPASRPSRGRPRCTAPPVILRAMLEPGRSRSIGLAGYAGRPFRASSSSRAGKRTVQGATRVRAKRRARAGAAASPAAAAVPATAATAGRPPGRREIPDRQRHRVGRACARRSVSATAALDLARRSPRSGATKSRIVQKWMLGVSYQL